MAGLRSWGSLGLRVRTDVRYSVTEHMFRWGVYPYTCLRNTRSMSSISGVSEGSVPMSHPCGRIVAWKLLARPRSRWSAPMSRLLRHPRRPGPCGCRSRCTAADGPSRPLSRAAALTLAVVAARPDRVPPGEANPWPSTGEVSIPAELPGVYIVQPGDTLWDIAVAIAPGTDPRGLVHELADAAGRQHAGAGPADRHRCRRAPGPRERLGAASRSTCRRGRRRSLPDVAHEQRVGGFQKMVDGQVQGERSAAIRARSGGWLRPPPAARSTGTTRRSTRHRRVGR